MAVTDSSIAADVSDFVGDQYQPETPGYTGGGFGADEGKTVVPDDSINEKYLKQRQEIEAQMLKSHQELIGENAQQQWGNSPATGLSMFQGRQPSYGRNGNVRGFRSVPGAPMAPGNDGLLSGKALENRNKGVDVSNPFNASLTPEKDWRATFGEKPGSNMVHLTGGAGSVPMDQTETGGLPGAGDWKKTVKSQYGTGSIRIAPAGHTPGQSLISHAMGGDSPYA